MELLCLRAGFILVFLHYIIIINYEVTLLLLLLLLVVVVVVVDDDDVMMMLLFVVVVVVVCFFSNPAFTLRYDFYNSILVGEILSFFCKLFFIAKACKRSAGERYRHH